MASHQVLGPRRSGTDNVLSAPISRKPQPFSAQVAVGMLFQEPSSSLMSSGRRPDLFYNIFIFIVIFLGFKVLILFLV